MPDSGIVQKQNRKKSGKIQKKTVQTAAYLVEYRGESKKALPPGEGRRAAQEEMDK
jgi:hypothetical protein